MLTQPLMGPVVDPVHRLVWSHGSEQLQGRFPQKLAAAGIQDTTYCRYLSAEAITSLERLVQHLWQGGVYSNEQLVQSGIFKPNKGMVGSSWRLTIPPGRLLAVHDLEGRLVGLRANPEVPIKLKARGQQAKVLKYLQPRGVPLHPYLPKISRERLQQLWASQTPYLLVITEGEDTTESPAQNLQVVGGLPVIFVGLPGVDGWMGRAGKLHPQLVPVLQGCAELVLAFDSDIMTKPEVRAALLRLGQAVMTELGGQVIPLQANWSVLRSLPKLRQAKYGLDDLLGELLQTGQNPIPIFEQLLAPQSAQMIRRCWQRLGTPWKEEQLTLPGVDAAYTATRTTIEDWLAAGLSTPQHQPRRVIASTPGVGKTEALARALYQRMESWSTTPEAHTAQELQQEIRSLEARKRGATLPETYALLQQLKEKRGELAGLYQQTLGGPLVVLFPNREALQQFKTRLTTLHSYTLPAWLALRTGRESPTDRDKVGAGSLVCAHHQPVAQVGTQRHSPSALACSHCFWGQEGRCGFLDALQGAHLAPVVLATADALLNASHELGHFSQIVIDEGLPHHLYEAIEIGPHLPQLLHNLRWGLESRAWEELYAPATLRQLLGVLGELETARTRFTQATPEELAQRGHQVSHWLDQDRIKGWLRALEQLPLKPLRWDLDQLEILPAAHYPWERPRYSRGPDGGWLHEESYGEEQKLAFAAIPLRATDALLEELFQAVLHALPGTQLTFEASRFPEQGVVNIHLYRPHSHLIEILSKSRVLNLDATPNASLLKAFLPDLQIERHDAALNIEIFQVLTGPMGKASQAQLQQLLPLLKILGKHDPLLLLTHKSGVEYLESLEEPPTSLIPVRGANGQARLAGWFGYHDRAFDDPLMKTAQTLVLAGGYTPNLGHLERLARMVERFLAVKKRTLPPTSREPYRIHSYGPQGYELVEACGDPLRDALIYEERTAALLQAINRPRPARRTQPLRVILYRADPVPPPYNRYVQVVGALEELFSVSLTMKNKANAARLLASWQKHGEIILDYFVEHWALPSAREVQRLAGGSRGKAGSITRALAWFSAQVLPQLRQDQPLTREHPVFLNAWAEAAGAFYEVRPTVPLIPLDEEMMGCYWIARYRYGDAADRLITWLCTRQLAPEVQAAMEQIQPIREVFAAFKVKRRHAPKGKVRGRGQP